MGAFRVLVAGGRHFTDYALLRATLDKLLAKRLPDVELLTAGGPGVPMLAASYAAARGLSVVAVELTHQRFHQTARRRQTLAAIAWVVHPLLIVPQVTSRLRH
jgi:hypothetical protein